MSDNERAAMAIERETGRRSLEVAQATISKLEKRIGVLEAQLDEARSEMETWRPKLPPPELLILEPRTTALLVLDLSTRCTDRRVPCSLLVPLIPPLLKKARSAGVFILYTIIHTQKGRPEGEVYHTFKPRPEEPVIYPDGYNKFTGGELQEILSQNGIKTVVIVGSAANFACLYTATAAAQLHDYEVVIPSDGIVTWTQYEHHYSLFQLTVLPGGVAQKIHITELDMITFSAPSSPHNKDVRLPKNIKNLKGK